MTDPSVRVPAVAKPALPTGPSESPMAPANSHTIGRLMSRFNLAFSLMSVIPLLICCYLITVKFFTVTILQGLNGIYFLMAVVFALLGLLVGRVLIREMIQRLVLTNVKLDQLNQMQAHFVNNVAHEFRSPLTIVKGALDNLHDGLHGPITTDQQDPVDMCLREINRLKRLVGDLLDVAHMEAGKMRLVQEEVVLQDLLRSVAKLVNGPLKERGLNLVLDLPEPSAVMVGDRDRLQQVFINLLTNAIKFTAQGEIRVRLTKDGETFQVVVEDTGRGIAKEDLEKVFNKFERVGPQEEEGSGLGLPIARDIVELHQGRLWAESELNRGSRFIAKLPIKPPVA